MPTLISHGVSDLLLQPYDHKFFEQSGDYIKLRNYSDDAFGFPRGGIFESGPIFIGKLPILDALDFYFTYSSYTHVGAQVRTMRRPEGPGAWYPAAGNIPEAGTNYNDNEWQVSHPTRLRVANDTDIYQSGGSSIRFDSWGAGEMYADCEFLSGYPTGYQFMLIPLRSTIDNASLQLMLDLSDVTDEERLVFAKYLSYDVILPEKDTWYTMVWDLQQFKTHPIKHFGILFQGASDPASIYLDKIELGNYWSDLAKTPQGDGSYLSSGDFSALTMKDYFQFRLLLGATNRLEDVYVSPGVKQIDINYSGPGGLVTLESVSDVMRHQKQFTPLGKIRFPRRNGPDLDLLSPGVDMDL